MLWIHTNKKEKHSVLYKFKKNPTHVFYAVLVAGVATVNPHRVRESISTHLGFSGILFYFFL